MMMGSCSKGDHQRNSGLGFSSGLGADVTLDEVDGVGVQGLSFLNPENAFLPVVVFLPGQSFGLRVVIQMESVDKIDSQDDVDS